MSVATATSLSMADATVQYCPGNGTWQTSNSELYHALPRHDLTRTVLYNTIQYAHDCRSSPNDSPHRMQCRRPQTWNRIGRKASDTAFGSTRREGASFRSSASVTELSPPLHRWNTILLRCVALLARTPPKQARRSQRHTEGISIRKHVATQHAASAN